MSTPVRSAASRRSFIGGSLSLGALAALPRTSAAPAAAPASPKPGILFVSVRFGTS